MENTPMTFQKSAGIDRYPNPDKIDDAVLALLHLTSFTEGKGGFAVTRAWKGHDWEALDRLHKKGLISDPKNRNKSVVFTVEGRQRAMELFHRLFCEGDAKPA